MTNQKPPAKKSPVRIGVLSVVFLIVAYVGYNKIHFAITHETTDNAQVETQITPVLPRVAGYVKTISVKDYDAVAAGQVLVELDDAELQTQLLESQLRRYLHDHMHVVGLHVHFLHFTVHLPTLFPHAQLDLFFFTLPCITP